MGNMQKNRNTDQPVEAMLELVPGEAGEVLLRRANSEEEPHRCRPHWVTSCTACHRA